ncbi:hypothetical protein DFH06DRAFT_1320058 [Mycena polygramma]|nr:hypothetical protein DFH06DRAFT_1320058 [Mycena polygramma]
MHSSTFSPAPLNGSLTIPQLLDHHLEKSPHHKAYIYNDEKFGVVSVEFSQYIRAVLAACRLIQRDTAPRRAGDVVAIFVDADTISYCMLVSAVMRAGFVPFCLSPRNAAAGIANLLQQTNAVAVYISSNLKSVMSEALIVLGTPLPVHEAPAFQQLQGEIAGSLPALQTVSMDSTAYILHTSGSTSIFSKPIYLSHKALLNAACPPWADAEDHSGQALGTQTLPNYHGIGVFLVTWPLTSGLTMAVLPPSTPPMRGTPENALNGIIATKPEFVMSTPASIEIWSESSRGLAMMQSLKALTYLGAPLNKRVGDALAAKGVVLCSTYGSMETGLVAPFLENHGVDWEYFSMRPDLEIVRVPEDDGSALYTHTYLLSPSFTPSSTNSLVDGRPGCYVSDLLEQHPHKPELHRVYGRKDDIIIFSSGLKVLSSDYDRVELLIALILTQMSPGSIEAHINRNPLVDAALVFGQAMTHPGILIQLKPEFRDHLVDAAQRAKVHDTLWASVEEANQSSPAHFQIPRKMILLADPEKPFALTSKLQPRRRVVLEDYQQEICAAYL